MVWLGKNVIDLHLDTFFVKSNKIYERASAEIGIYEGGQKIQARTINLPLTWTEMKGHFGATTATQFNQFPNSMTRLCKAEPHPWTTCLAKSRTHGNKLGRFRLQQVVLFHMAKHKAQRFPITRVIITTMNYGVTDSVDGTQPTINKIVDEAIWISPWHLDNIQDTCTQK